MAKIRKSKRKGGAKSIYSIPKLIADVERCFTMPYGEVRDIFAEELNKHFCAWRTEQIRKGLMNQRAEEIANTIDLWQNEAKKLEEESQKTMASSLMKDKCLEEARGLMAKCRFLLDMTTYHLGKTSEDFLGENWTKT